MASNQNNSSSHSSEPEEQIIFGRSIEIETKAIRRLFETTETAVHRPARASTSVQRPIREEASSSLSSIPDDSNVDKTVDPGLYSEDSSDKRSRRTEQRE